MFFAHQCLKMRLPCASGEGTEAIASNSIWADFTAPGGPATVYACADVPLS